MRLCNPMSIQCLIKYVVIINHALDESTCVSLEVLQEARDVGIPTYVEVRCVFIDQPFFMMMNMVDPCLQDFSHGADAYIKPNSALTT